MINEIKVLTTIKFLLYLVLLGVFRNGMTDAVVIDIVVTMVIYYLFNSYFIERDIDKLLVIAFVNIINFIITINSLPLTIGITIYSLMFLYQILSNKFLKKHLKQEKSILIIGETEKKPEALKLIEESDDYKGVHHFFKDDLTLFDEKNFMKFIKEKKIHEILVLDKDLKNQVVTNILNVKVTGIKIYNYYEFFEYIRGQLHLEELDEKKLLFDHGFGVYHNQFQKQLKRTVDIILAISVAIVVAPIVVVAALIVKLESRGPVLFKQDRVGEGNKVFKMIKFRSMKLHDENAHSKYAGKTDSRITNFGKIMRKTRIDELPQLWNVIKGEMSFVGPRAEWVKLANEYEKNISFFPLRHTVRPGLTGWAQVNYPYGASEDDMKKKLMYDLYYVKHQTAGIDLVILLKTAGVVFLGKGQ
ncbi:exopolysaccharide biosynthesis polyprenyl glycosylphosphotransferase [Psychrilyobacter atlanticus]|uniref:exopolysaccharide biosynthesis polyprenyl glycosylphosphotransferase n=1 Tax=Psychrilyobacter atlanticus TaxID=271091 RepID=UPI000567C4CC|nr:exopolysaccharide biosynthesis polyprenyl glycosylphosphotransferase [Psychrilyobacter atlanticus]